MNLSVVTVTRNNLESLRRTHESLKAQDSRDYEWIVIDGASQDGTDAFLRATCARWLSEPDDGIYDAMNKGMAMARGDYILFLNAGDALADKHMLSALALACENRPDFIYGDGIEDGMIKTARDHEQCLGGMFTYHQAMFYKAALIGSLRYDTRYRLAADFKFTVQFLRRAKRIAYWPHPVCIFESGGASQVHAAAARIELSCLRRELGLCGPLQDAAIRAGQAATAALRQRQPGLYSLLRGKKRAPSE
jgi:putative colanic acid biosynthesis glycosyltransferase